MTKKKREFLFANRKRMHCGPHEEDVLRPRERGCTVAHTKRIPKGRERKRERERMHCGPHEEDVLRPRERRCRRTHVKRPIRRQ